VNRSSIILARMKTIYCILVALSSISLLSFCTENIAPDGVPSANLSAQNIATDFYSLTYSGIRGEAVSMSTYKGKYVLCVNVASECGNTPQYAALQQLYDAHKNQLVVVGFPCNQFGKQEPDNEKQIEDFCTKNYGVTFPLASKVDVKGENQHPVYAWLTGKELNDVSDAKVEWNFHKFLVSPDGEWLKSFSAGSEPLEVVEWLK